MSEFVKGPWRKGKTAGAIVADTPPSMSRPEYAEREKEYYGGYLIAESISPENEPLIIAAPDMYKLLQSLKAFMLVDAKINGGRSRMEFLDRIDSVLAKAEGKEKSGLVSRREKPSI